MTIKKSAAVLGAMILSLSAQDIALAKVSAAEAEKLGTALTPMGSEKKGNAAGTIPAWEGGITKIPEGYKKGDHHPDPFASDAVLFTIDSTNFAKYKDNLSVGQVALFETYPTFKMNVYPSRRSASYPQIVYEKTKVNATRSKLRDNGNGLIDAAIGFPFPIPQSGLEVLWNHIVRYRGTQVARVTGQATPTRSGAYTLVKFSDQLDVVYARPGITPQQLEEENLLFLFKQWVVSPARLAGTALIVHESIDQISKPRQAWTYNTGQRRVRRAPNIAYDAPGVASDGLRTSDDLDMFNGAPNRYEWTLIGKKEVYIPYNSYKLHSDKVKYDDIITASHINVDLPRYELHRVWVVEANLKSGTRHIYKKRRFYFDEDSWQIALSDTYDRNDQLWRVGFAHILNYYEVPTQWTTLEVIHDLQSGRYIATGLDNEDDMIDFGVSLTDRDFSAQSLRKLGRR